MKNIVILAFVSAFSLLIAKEAGQSAIDVVENQSLYEGVVGVASYNEYVLLAVSFWAAGFIAATAALYLAVLRIVKK
jgi:hydrogenase/urease accessory protein HupE